jgi:3-hydroxyisobutyrate dehydrogenase-like beta-hydroxyacid dehydrogenase
MKIGFIGLGHMGIVMARNLLKAGHELTVYNRTASKADPLVKEGAHRAAKVADACRGDVVVTMLADDPAHETVIFGEDGVLKNLRKDAVHICCGTISVALSERLTTAHAEHGQQYVAAPVFGRPEAAAAAKLFIVAAGPTATLDRCAPLFAAMGQKTFLFGATPSNANLVKVSGNFLISAVIESLGEALALIAKAGLDRSQYVDFLTSTLFSAPIYKTYGGIIAAQKFPEGGFNARLGLKDNRLVLAAAETLEVPLPLANLVHDRFLSLLAQGGESLDWSAIAELASREAGIERKAA